MNRLKTEKSRVCFGRERTSRDLPGICLQPPVYLKASPGATSTKALLESVLTQALCLAYRHPISFVRAKHLRIAREIRRRLSEYT